MGGNYHKRHTKNCEECRKLERSHLYDIESSDLE